MLFIRGKYCIQLNNTYLSNRASLSFFSVAAVSGLKKHIHNGFLSLPKITANILNSLLYDLRLPNNSNNKTYAVKSLKEI